MSPEVRREVARKGGLAVSKNRAHMAAIGKKGGLECSKDRAFMAKIGRKGGNAIRFVEEKTDAAPNTESTTP